MKNTNIVRLEIKVKTTAVLLTVSILVLLLPTALLAQAEVGLVIGTNNSNTNATIATTKTSWPQLRGPKQGHSAEGISLPTHVIKPSKSKLKILATKKLDSNIQATLALVDDSIILRTKNSMCRIIKQ